MKKNLIVPAAAVVLGLILFGVVLMMGEQLPAGGVGLCAGFGGALIGLGGGKSIPPPGHGSHETRGPEGGGAGRAG